MDSVTILLNCLFFARSLSILSMRNLPAAWSISWSVDVFKISFKATSILFLETFSFQRLPLIFDSKENYARFHRFEHFYWEMDAHQWISWWLRLELKTLSFWLKKGEKQFLFSSVQKIKWWTREYPDLFLYTRYKKFTQMNMGKMVFLTRNISLERPPLAFSILG